MLKYVENGARYGVGVNRSQIGNCIWAVDSHCQLSASIALKGQRSKVKVKYIFSRSSRKRREIGDWCQQKSDRIPHMGSRLAQLPLRHNDHERSMSCTVGPTHDHVSSC